ncbi:MAG: hypothetical protein IV094_11745 [Vitreoscilla sp.]|nr:hypothetical protein [Vitreoscilla sp.]
MAQNEVSDANVMASPEVVTFINTTERSDAQILRQIESLSVSADAKALLADLLKLATRVGQTVLRVGRKIIDFVLSLLRAFPHLGFAALVALVATALISLVPFIGLAFASVLGPLALALGIVVGGALDFQSPDLETRVRDFVTEFSGLAS